jgi:signal peptidase II
MTRASRIVLAAAVALASVACDQGTKHIAVSALRDRPPVEFFDRTVRFFYAENPGAWGSLGAQWPAPLKQAIFIALPLLFLAAAVVYLARRQETTRAEVVAIALLVGGGLGNLCDRLAHGYVVDFMYVGRGWLATNVFNVADLAIVAGAVLMFVVSRRRPRVAATPG